MRADCGHLLEVSATAAAAAADRACELACGHAARAPSHRQRDASCQGYDDDHSKHYHRKVIET